MDWDLDSDFSDMEDDLEKDDRKDDEKSAVNSTNDEVNESSEITMNGDESESFSDKEEIEEEDITEEPHVILPTQEFALQSCFNPGIPSFKMDFIVFRKVMLLTSESLVRGKNCRLIITISLKDGNLMVLAYDPLVNCEYICKPPKDIQEATIASILSFEDKSENILNLVMFLTQFCIYDLGTPPQDEIDKILAKGGDLEELSKKGLVRHGLKFGAEVEMDVPRVYLQVERSGCGEDECSD